MGQKSTIWIILLIVALVPGVSCATRDVPEEAVPVDDVVDVPTTSTDRFGFYDMEVVTEEVVDTVGPEEIRRTVYTVNGAIVMVMETVPSNSGALLDIYSEYLRDIGARMQTVVLGEEGVYVIESDDPYAADVVRYELDLAPIQKIKLTPHTVYGEAVYVGEAMVTGEQLESMSEDVGFDIDIVVNQEIRISGEMVRVNFIKPSEDTGPLRALDALAVMKRSDEGLYILDDYVIEIPTMNRSVAEQVWKLINIPPPSRTGNDHFTVGFSAIPIFGRDYTLLREVDAAASGTSSLAEIIEIDPTIEAGGTLPLYLSLQRTRVEMAPEGLVELVDDSIASVSWPEEEGVPEVVNVAMVVETGRSIDYGPETELPYKAMTPFWPVGNERMREIVWECMEAMEGEGRYVLTGSIFNWVKGHVGQSDDIARITVEEALEQGNGGPWVQSDVLITIARTAGLPTRQVAGWIYGRGRHVWTQVWLAEEGYWLDVDTGRDSVGADSYYIPIWGTRDGRMPYLYRDGPVVQRVNGR